MHGFVLAVMSSVYDVVKYFKMWERARTGEGGDADGAGDGM